MGKEPPSLYSLCLLGYVRNLNHNVASLDRLAELRLLPTAVLATVYDQMCNFDALQDILLVQLTDLNTFHKLIKQTSLKPIMFRCVQTLMASRRPIVTELRTKFCRATTVYYLQNVDASSSLMKDANCYREDGRRRHDGVRSDDAAADFMEQINNGLRLGSFLSECGWLEESLHVFNITLLMIQLLVVSYTRYLIELNCLQKLLYAQTAFCCFKEANISCAHALNIIDKLTQQHRQQQQQHQLRLRRPAGKACNSDESISNSSSSSRSHRSSCNKNKSNFSDFSSEFNTSQYPSGKVIDSDKDSLSGIPNSLLANIYQQISVLHFYRSEYDLSYRWSIRALKHTNRHTPDKIVVDVLRQMAKSCVVKRQFQSASMFIKQAVCRARTSFGTTHQKYADAMLDYGFFLLNVDSIANSVAVYTEAHEILCRNFGPRNLHVAVAHEDLAYCLYVLEYSSGKFDSATANVERAIDIMKELVPCNHLMLASAKRVKALILEEIALDSMASTIDFFRCKSLLDQSEELHRSALHLSLEAFGENNVQTAKHYGNLGRLYQTMSRYEEAEQMHKRAIKIKKQILGPYDYEVGLSIGHLASLYNYHMHKHQEAEELYLKTIEISLRIFGESYSGLEYDYRGLIHIYEINADQERYDQYSNILEQWRMLREDNKAVKNNFLVDLTEDTSMEEVTRKFFEMCSNSNCLTGAAAVDPPTVDSSVDGSEHETPHDSGESGLGEEEDEEPLMAKGGEEALKALSASSSSDKSIAEDLLRST